MAGKDRAGGDVAVESCFQLAAWTGTGCATANANKSTAATRSVVTRLRDRMDFLPKLRIDPQSDGNCIAFSTVAIWTNGPRRGSVGLGDSQGQLVKWGCFVN